MLKFEDIDSQDIEIMLSETEVFPYCLTLTLTYQKPILNYFCIQNSTPTPSSCSCLCPPQGQCDCNEPQQNTDSPLLLVPVRIGKDWLHQHHQHQPQV